MSSKFIEQYNKNKNKALLTENLQNNKLIETESKTVKGFKIDNSIIKDSKKCHGKYIKSKNNKPIEIKNYFLGKLDGEYIENYQSGKLMRKTFFDDGILRNGEIKSYHENGTEYEVYTIKAEKIVGQYKSFYQSKNLAVDAKYNNNGRIISMDIYDDIPNSKPHTMIKFDQNEKISSIDIQNSSIGKFSMKSQDNKTYEMFCKNGNMTVFNNNGKFINTYSNGNIQLETFYKNGRVYGPFYYYYNDGSLMIDAEFQDNKVISFAFFDTRGKLITSM